ncbi:MAG: methyltransferase domain-containing protein [Bacilli bacterium]
MSKLQLHFKTIIYSLTNTVVDSSHISQYFNELSNNYNKQYFNNITSSSTPMLDEIIYKLQSTPKDNLNILDIGCGTGFNSNYLYSKLKTGTYTLVDISEGMLLYAKKLCNFNCSFIENDMLDYLKSCSTDSMDIIVCSYAISYHLPKEIIKECSRVLKNGGFLGVIDNLKRTLPEINKLCSKLIVNNSHLLNKPIIKLNYSSNEYFFEKMFVDNRFNRINLKSDHTVINFDNKASLCYFLCSSGILTPLDFSINLEDYEAKLMVSNLLDTYNINSLTHKYIWGTFRNDK